MELKSVDKCRDYVTRELDKLGVLCPDWLADRTTHPSDPELSWRVELTGESLPFWYMVEARLVDQEFLIWFGNYQVGIEQLHWIMRPAVHIAFSDLVPRGHLDPKLAYSLSEVLQGMILSLENPGGLENLRFQPSTFSMT